MSDNGKDLKQEKPKENKLIFKVELTPDNQFVYQICGQFIPMLTYGLKLIETEVDKMIINNKIKAQMTKDANSIVNPSNLGLNVNDFLKRGHRR